MLLPNLRDIPVKVTYAPLILGALLAGCAGRTTPRPERADVPQREHNWQQLAAATRSENPAPVRNTQERFELPKSHLDDFLTGHAKPQVKEPVAQATSPAPKSLPPAGASSPLQKTAKSLPMNPQNDKLSTRDVQVLLQTLGYYHGKLDGSNGPQTQKALKRFQKARGLKADGVAGVKTRKELLAQASRRSDVHTGTMVVTRVSGKTAN